MGRLRRVLRLTDSPLHLFVVNNLITFIFYSFFCSVFRWLFLNFWYLQCPLFLLVSLDFLFSFQFLIACFPYFGLFF